MQSLKSVEIGLDTILTLEGGLDDDDSFQSRCHIRPTLELVPFLANREGREGEERWGKKLNAPFLISSTTLSLANVSVNPARPISVVE